MKRHLADFLIWLLSPLLDWCWEHGTWVPLEDVFDELSDEQS